jgi:hypothetical protein
MDPNRKLWNQQQKALRHALEHPDDNKKAINLFLSQHAMVHSAKMSKSGLHSFEDEILHSLSEDAIRCIPRDGNHSIAWIIWHLARIEDVTMNLLIADTSQILNGEDWPRQLRIKIRHVGCGMSDQDVADLSAQINVEALIEYRVAVGKTTREIVRKLGNDDFYGKSEPSRIQRIWSEGAMLPEGQSIVDYWAGRTVAGLLLMPPTRHCFLHLNEARRIRQKIDSTVHRL